MPRLTSLDVTRYFGLGSLAAAIRTSANRRVQDVTIVHLAVGWGVLQLKVGSFSRSERMAKWNEALRIEEALDGRARFAGAEPWRGWVAT